MTESHPAPPPAPPSKPPRSGPLRPVLFIMIVFFGVFAVVAASKLFTPKELVPWRSDLTAAIAEAKAANKPVLLYFTAEWCGPCQYMRRNVFTDAAVAEAMEAYVPVRLDHDAHENDLVLKYQLDGVPWFGVLDAEGRAVRVLDRGVETPQEMIAWLKGP